MATHKELVAEGNKIDAALSTMQKIVMDKSAIPEQLRQVKAHGDTKIARLKVIRAALDLDCAGCNHPKGHHASGTAQCLDFEETGRCACKQWNVDV